MTKKGEKINITAIIKTSNSEDCICNTLESIKNFSEIVVIDEHSKDDTIEIASEYKAKIIYASKPDLSQGFNQALAEAKNNWIFLIEDDEILPEKLIDEISSYIENPKKNKNALDFSQKYFYFNKEIKSAGKSRVLRLFKKDCAELTDGKIKLKEGKIFHVNKKQGCILKFQNRDFSKRLAGIVEKNKEKLKASKTCPSIIIKPALVFFCTYFLKGALFDGVLGFVFAKEKYIEEFLLQASILEKKLKGENNDL